MLQNIVSRGAPTVANDVLRWTKRIFNYGIKRHILEVNPAAAFELADAGGQEKSRERFLTDDELSQLFSAMKKPRDSADKMSSRLNYFYSFVVGKWSYAQLDGKT